MKQSQPPGISLRIILIGMILIPINCYWLVLSRQPYQYQSIPTIISPFFNVVFIVFVLALFNRPMTKYAPRLSLTHGELITVYIMLSLTSAIQSFQMMQTLVPVMEYPFRVASPGERLAEPVRPIYSIVVIGERQRRATNLLSGRIHAIHQATH